MISDDCRVLIAGGGTAGHVIPAVAIGKALYSKGILEKENEVHFVRSWLSSVLVVVFSRPNEVVTTRIDGRADSKLISASKCSVRTLAGVWVSGNQRAAVPECVGWFVVFFHNFFSVLRGRWLVVLLPIALA